MGFVAKSWPISISRLANEVLNGSGITSTMLLNDLIERGFIVDVHTPTAYGLKHGVSVAQKDGSPTDKWLVYDSRIQQYYIEHIHEIRDKNHITASIQNKPVASGRRGDADLQDPGFLKWYQSLKPIPRTAKTDTNPARISSSPTSMRDFKDKIDAALAATISKAKFTSKYPAIEEIRNKYNLTGGVERYPITGRYHQNDLIMPKDFVVIDTETTGMGGNDEVIELSVVSKEGTELYHSYFLPTCGINPEAFRVHQISKVQLMNMRAPSFVSEWPKIVKAVDGRPILGHNIGFDKRMIVGTLRKLGGNAAQAEQMFQGMFDSMNILKNFIESPSYKIEAIAHLLGICRDEMHGSTDDCRMTLEVLERLSSILESKKVNATSEDVFKYTVLLRKSYTRMDLSKKGE